MPSISMPIIYWFTEWFTYWSNGGMSWGLILPQCSTIPATWPIPTTPTMRQGSRPEEKILKLFSTLRSYRHKVETPLKNLKLVNSLLKKGKKATHVVAKQLLAGNDRDTYLSLQQTPSSMLGTPQPSPPTYLLTFSSVYIFLLPPNCNANI